VAADDDPAVQPDFNLAAVTDLQRIAPAKPDPDRILFLGCAFVGACALLGSLLAFGLGVARPIDGVIGFFGAVVFGLAILFRIKGAENGPDE
jgi:hypothetical protein